MMSASLIALLLILVQHHPPPPPPSGFGLFSVIVSDEPDTGNQNNFNNRRFNRAVRGTRAIEAPNGQSFIGFCQVYNGVSSGQIDDLNFRNWRFLVNYTGSNSAIAEACNVDVASACQLANSQGVNINRIRRCRRLPAPITKELQLFLIISFAFICLKSTTQGNKAEKNILKMKAFLKKFH